MLSYNEFWYERGVELTADKRTSLIVDPPDGRIPYAPGARGGAGAAAAEPAERIRGPLHRPEPLRPLHHGLQLRPADDGRLLQQQRPDPPGARLRRRSSTRWSTTPGSSRSTGGRTVRCGSGRAIRAGAGKGETLVVETTNFLTETSLRGSSRDTELVERFRRVDPDTVMYEFTVEDPNNYSRPWTMTMPLRRTDGPLFEYACHEGNIGMHGIMAGARRKDTQRVDEVR